jgi:multiple sugar transport system substrate-binding protein
MVVEKNLFKRTVQEICTSLGSSSTQSSRLGVWASRRSFINAINGFLLGVSAEFLSASSRRKPELHFVAWKYHLVGQEEYYKDLAKAFERAHPGMRIIIEFRDWTAAHNEIQHWVSEGNGPDLTIIPDLWLPEFAPGLDDYVSRLPVKLLEDMNPIMLKRSRFRGQILGLVWAASTKALFYRTDLFKHAGIRPPSNWSELRSAAQKLTQLPNLYGLAIPGAPEDDTADNFYFFLWSNGGRLFTPSGKPALDTPDAIEALTFLRDLVRKSRVTEPNVVQCDRTCAEDLFARGKAAMVETGPWLIRTIAAQTKPVPFSVVPLPWKKEAITQLVTDHLVLLRSSRYKSEALEFIKFAYQPSWRLRWTRLGMVPALKTVENDAFFKNDPVWSVFISQLSHARWIPLMNIKWVKVDRAIRNAEGEVLAGRAEPQAALESLSKQIQILLADDPRQRS